MLLKKISSEQTAQHKKTFAFHYLRWLHATDEQTMTNEIIEMKKVESDSGLPLNGLIPEHVKPQIKEEVLKKKRFKKAFNAKPETKVIPLKKQMANTPTHVIVGAEMFA